MEICNEVIRTKGMLFRTAYLDGEGYQFPPNPESALEFIRKYETRIDLFTFIPRLSDTKRIYRYPMEWDNMAVLSLTTYDHWITHQISSRVRSIVRKTARDGLVVREVPFDDALIRGISAIYNETPVRQGRRFGHYGIGLDDLRKMKSTFLDRATFIGAFFEGKLVGFAKLVADEERSQAGLMHILSMIQHRDKAPTNALIAQAVRSCVDRGISYLWYVKFYYGQKGHDSLAEFKRRNGFQKVDLPRYYIPLTFRGRIALHLGLHRGIFDRIPGPLAATYRKVRSFWYAKRFHGLENA